jgi:phosphoserine phosphatase RsbU/P
MNQTNSTKNSNKKFRQTIREDFKNINFKKDFSNEYKSLSHFYLDSEKKSRLETMTPFQRWKYKTGWLLKSMFLHLTPLRRILALAGAFFLFIGSSVFKFDESTFTINNGMLGGVLILFVLFLELKDKLLAKNELEEGRKVQQALMPQQNPEIAGWNIWLFTRPANEVGGDLVDYLKLDENKTILTIADVAGKGLQAALLTSKLQATLRALATDYTSLSDLGKKINKIFHRDSLPSLFASMLIMQIESNNEKINFINAGHFPPLIFKGMDIKEFSKGNAALGLISDSDYVEQSFSLEQDETLIAYSDGVFEARNENGDFFGMDRFFKLLENSSQNSPQQIGSKIIAHLDYFVNDSPPADDISIIIVKRKS